MILFGKILILILVLAGCFAMGMIGPTIRERRARRDRLR
jgi:hypothetical protein